MSSGANIYARDVLHFLEPALAARDLRIKREREALIAKELEAWRMPIGWRLLFPKFYPVVPPTRDEVTSKLKQCDTYEWCSPWAYPSELGSSYARRAEQLVELAKKAKAHSSEPAFVFLSAEDCALLRATL